MKAKTIGHLLCLLDVGIQEVDQRPTQKNHDIPVHLQEVQMITYQKGEETTDTLTITTQGEIVVHVLRQGLTGTGKSITEEGLGRLVIIEKEGLGPPKEEG